LPSGSSATSGSTDSQNDNTAPSSTSTTRKPK
jgi:hypothetical protein